MMERKKSTEYEEHFKACKNKVRIFEIITYMNTTIDISCAQ
jgi:hypothetical protein